MDNKNVPLTEIRSVVKIGHTHYISLPAIFCRACAIKKGDKLTLEVYPDKIIFLGHNGNEDIQPDASATEILLKPTAKASERQS